MTRQNEENDKQKTPEVQNRAEDFKNWLYGIREQNNFLKKKTSLNATEELLNLKASL
jgi:hypothetical protein